MTYPNENVVVQTARARESAREAMFASLAGMSDMNLFATATSEGLDPANYQNRFDLMTAIVNKKFPNLYEPYTYHYETPVAQQAPASPGNYMKAEPPLDPQLYRDLADPANQIPKIDEGGVNPAHPEVASEPLVFVGYRDWTSGAIAKLDVTDLAWTSGFLGSGEQAPVAVVTIPNWFIHEKSIQSLLVDLMNGALAHDTERLINDVTQYAKEAGWDTKKLWNSAYEVWEKTSGVLPEDANQPTAGRAPTALNEPTQATPTIAEQ